MLYILQIKGLRRNEDAMKYKCWYQKKLRYQFFQHIINNGAKFRIL